MPPGFTVVQRKGKPVDVNAGTTGERVFLCIKKGHGNPIRYALTATTIEQQYCI